MLQKADHIFITQLKKFNLYSLVSQAFCVLLPIKTVGVMGDKRTYENVICLRSVDRYNRFYDLLISIKIKI